MTDQAVVYRNKWIRSIHICFFLTFLYLKCLGVPQNTERMYCFSEPSPCCLTRKSPSLVKRFSAFSRGSRPWNHLKSSPHYDRAIVI